MVKNLSWKLGKNLLQSLYLFKHATGLGDKVTMKVFVSVLILIGLAGCWYFFMSSAKQDHLASYRKDYPVEKKQFESAPKFSSKQSSEDLKPLPSRVIASFSGEEARDFQDLLDAEQYIIAGTTYMRSKSVYAVLKASWDPHDPQIIGEHLGHFLIKSASPINGAFPVFLNQKSSQYAIITKILKVKLADFELRHQVFDNYQIHREFSHINLVLYRFDTLDELIQANQLSVNNPQVLRASIEILEHARIGQ